MTNGQSENKSKIPSSVGKADVDPGFAIGISGPEETDQELAFYKLFSSLVSAMTKEKEKERLSAATITAKKAMWSLHTASLPA